MPTELPSIDGLGNAAESKPASSENEHAEATLVPSATAHSTVPGPQACDVFRRRVERSLSVETITTIAELKSHLPAWEELSLALLEPNLFYEPFQLLPALEYFGIGKEFRFVLIYGSDRSAPKRSPALVGFFPLERRRVCHGMPIKNLSLWGCVHCFLRTPLIHKAYVHEVMTEFFEWLQESGSAVIDFPMISGNGPFSQALIRQLHLRERPVWVHQYYNRALLRQDGDVDGYLRQVISGKKLTELRRQERRLGQCGALEYVELQPDGDVEYWLDTFMTLEASGWKARQGDSLASTASGREFFLSVAREAFRKTRLQMLAIHLDNRMIAMKCNFWAQPGSFAFKIAFDEQYSKYSPGVLLEIENIRRMYAAHKIQWMDSCANAEHPMIDGIWGERRTISSILAGTGRFPGGFATSVFPILRWLKHKVLGLGNRLR